MTPEKFNNKTNGITPRRWLAQANPGLAKLITSKIGEQWITDLSQLKKIAAFAQDGQFQKEWMQIKQHNKEVLAKYIEQHNKIKVNPHSIFDCHVKRMHEYKRQLLNVLHAITLYAKIKHHPEAPFVPRTIIFAGKSAAGYFMAKLIIRLINAVADTINRDPEVGDKLKVVFLENYRVSLAEKIMPAADLSEQISTAGTEASGTGNMKFQLNGALTIGTLDGANIEIMEEVGPDNIFIFGLNAEQVDQVRANYNPWDYYERIPALKECIDLINNDFFNAADPGLFRPITDSLLKHGDHYMVMADYESFCATQEKVSELYQNQALWAEKSILNTAHAGKFSSDRAVAEYAKEIWHVVPVPPHVGPKRGGHK